MANQSDPVDGLIFSSQSSSSGNVLTINKGTGAAAWLNVPNYTGIVGYDDLKNKLIYFGTSGGTTQLYAYDIRSGTAKLVTTGIPNNNWQAGGIGAVNSYGRIAYLFDSADSKVFVTNLDNGAQLTPISIPTGTVQLTLDEQHQTLVGLNASGGHSQLITVDLKTGMATISTTPVATVTANYVQAISARTSSYYFQGGNSSSTITVVSLTDGTVKGSFPAPLRLFALPQVILGGDIDSTYALSIDDPSASLVKEGTGTVTLTGNNIYGGGTLITSGGLSISSDNNLGNGGTVAMNPDTTLAFTAGGTYSHSVTVAGDPIFDVSAGQTVTYNGVIADGASAGTLEKADAGTLILTAANTYTGGTTVAGGVLQTAGLGTLGASSGSVIVSGGTLDLGATAQMQNGGVTLASGAIQNGTLSSSGTFALESGMVSAVLAGSGTLNKTTSGTVILSGTDTYTGATTVSAGTLTVMGSLVGPIAVAGGKLNGNGTVGVLNITSGTFAPGDAVGAMHVTGGLSLASGTTYAAEITPTIADEAIVSGSASIANGVTLVLSPDAGNYTAGTTYTLLNAAGGLSGTFSTVSINGSFGANVRPVVSYDAHDVDLTLDPVLTCNNATAPSSANPSAACKAVVNGSASSGLFLVMSNLSVNATATSATLAQLSGDIHASLRSAMIEDGKIIRDTVINHAIAGGGAATIWAAGFGAYGSIDGDGNAAALHHNDSGVIVGADAPVAPGFNLGVGAALTTQRANLPVESASASGNSDHLIGYANWTDQAWVASLGVDLGWGANQVIRNITSFSEIDSDHQTNRLTQVFGEIGYRVPADMFDLMALEPYLDLADVTARTNAFAETGGVGALTGEARSANENYVTLGLRAAVPEWSMGDFGIVPNLNVGWQHAFSHFLPSQILTFAQTSQSFTVLGVPLDSDAATIQAGLDILLSPAAILSIGYDGEISSRVQDHAIRAELSWKF
jgi:autotransporter-associated beta strand protein